MKTRIWTQSTVTLLLTLTTLLCNQQFLRSVRYLPRLQVSNTERAEPQGPAHGLAITQTLPQQRFERSWLLSTSISTRNKPIQASLINTAFFTNLLRRGLLTTGGPSLMTPANQPPQVNAGPIRGRTASPSPSVRRMSPRSPSASPSRSRSSDS